MKEEKKVQEEQVAQYAPRSMLTRTMYTRIMDFSVLISQSQQVVAAFNNGKSMIKKTNVLSFVLSQNTCMCTHCIEMRFDAK